MLRGRRDVHAGVGRAVSTKAQEALLTTTELRRRGTDANDMTEVEAALAVLKHCRSRIMLAAEEVLHLWEVWSAFNRAAELRPAIAHSRAGLAAAVYEKASLDMLVIVVIRLLEGPAKDKRRNFQVFQKHLRLPGIADALIRNAANSMTVLLDDVKPEEASTTVRDRIAAFHARLDRLKEDRRLKMLGQHRNANLGHELVSDPSGPKPTYDQLEELVNQVFVLAEDVEAIVPSGLPLRRGEASKSAAALWKAVAATFPAGK